MAEVYKTKRLKIASAIFIALIVIGFLTFHKPLYKYALTPEQALVGLSLPESTIDSIEIREIINSEKKNAVLVDVRNIQDYVSGHINGAINIPLIDILKEQNYSHLRDLDQDQVNIIIYGKDHLQANGAFMLLKQLGFKNMKFIASEFDIISKMNNDGLKELQLLENMFMDDSIINQFVNPTSKKDSTTEDPPEKITPVKKAKKNSSEGGC